MPADTAADKVGLTVDDLLEALRRCPPDALVVIHRQDGKAILLEHLRPVRFTRHLVDATTGRYRQEPLRGRRNAVVLVPHELPQTDPALEY